MIIYPITRMCVVTYHQTFIGHSFTVFHLYFHPLKGRLDAPSGL
jgi:hypothetical protein